MTKTQKVTRRHLANKKRVYVVKTATDADRRAGFGVGTRLLLDYDNGSLVPCFKREGDAVVTRWMNLSALELAPTEAPTKPTPASRFKVGDTVVIKKQYCGRCVDYRPGKPAKILEVSRPSEGHSLPIRIEYLDKADLTSRVLPEYIEHHVPEVKAGSIAVTREAAEAFVDFFTKGPRSGPVNMMFEELSKQVESKEVRDAKRTLTSAGYTVAKEEGH